MVVVVGRCRPSVGLDRGLVASWVLYSRLPSTTTTTKTVYDKGANRRLCWVIEAVELIVVVTQVVIVTGRLRFSRDVKLFVLC